MSDRNADRSSRTDEHPYDAGVRQALTKQSNAAAARIAIANLRRDPDMMRMQEARRLDGRC